MEDQTRQGSFAFPDILNILIPVLIINEFAYIVFSGCEELLDKQELKPSSVKQVIKTWKLKGRVYHEINGCTFDEQDVLHGRTDCWLRPHYVTINC